MKFRLFIFKPILVNFSKGEHKDLEPYKIGSFIDITMDVVNIR